jgi:hypothetical protein
MRLRRRVANFFLRNCGLRYLHGTKASRLTKSILDEIDLQHLRDSNPCKSCGGREEMYDYVHQYSIRQEAIDYLEFGVFRGESIRYWTTLSTNNESRFFGFDSFEGLPEEWRPDKLKGHFDVGGNMPQIADGRVKLVKGWFKDTIPRFVRDFMRKNRLVIHIDADLYGSAMLALVHLGPFMSKGTLILFDELYDREHEFKAFMDFQRIFPQQIRIVAEVGNYGKICAELV